MHLEYTVEKKELLESLRCLDWKKEGVRKRIHVSVLTLLGGYCLFLYYREPENLMAFFLCALIVTLLMLILYLPGFRRRRKAEQILRHGAQCVVDFPVEGILHVFETDRVITLQKKDLFYCIPKSALQPGDQAYLEKEVYPYAQKVIEVTL